jgi:DNA-binding transcriptional regulator GbsR (MarR family)
LSITEIAEKTSFGLEQVQSALKTLQGHDQVQSALKTLQRHDVVKQQDAKYFYRVELMRRGVAQRTGQS